MEIKRLLIRLGVVALVLAACGAGDSAGTSAGPVTAPTTAESSACEPGQVDGDLHTYTRPDYIDPSLVSRFEEEFGVDVVEDFYRSSELVVPKLQSGAKYDLIIPSDSLVASLIERGLLHEIQRDAVPNLSNLEDRFADPPYDPGGAHSVALHWGTVGLRVDTDVAGTEEGQTWALVFDPELIEGRRVSLLDDPRQTMGAALKYLGYSLNTIDPQQLQEAADVITAAIEAGAALNSDVYEEQVFNGDVSAAHGYSDRLGNALVDREDRTYVVPREGAAIWVDAMAIPATADHSCTAHTFINYLLDAHKGAAQSSWNRLASSNEAAEQYTNPEILEDESVYPPQSVAPLLEFVEDLGAFERVYTDLFAIAGN